MPIFPVESGLTFGDEFTLGGVTFIWTDDGSGAGYWKKKEVVDVKINAGDQEIVYSNNGNANGSPQLSYDYTVNKLKLSATPSQSSNYLLEITDKTGNKYNSIKPSGLFEGEVANGSIQARVNGQWTSIPASVSSFVQDSTPTTSGITTNSLWFETDQRRWNYFNGSAWSRLYAFDYKLTAAPVLDQDASALYSKGDLVLFQSGTGSGAQRELFAVTSGTDGSGIKYIPIGGYQFQRSLISKAPTASNPNTITAQDSSSGLLVDGNGVSEKPFQVYTQKGRTVWVDDNADIPGRFVVAPPGGNTFWVNPDHAESFSQVYLSPGDNVPSGSLSINIDHSSVPQDKTTRAIRVTNNVDLGTSYDQDILSQSTSLESRYADNSLCTSIQKDGRVYVRNPVISTNRGKIGFWADFRDNVGPAGQSWRYDAMRVDLPLNQTGLSVNDCFIRLNSGGATRFRVQFDGGTYGKYFWSESDLSLKQNVEYLDSSKSSYTGLAATKQLQPASFSYTSTPEFSELGFIAQDVEKVIPLAVRVDTDPDSPNIRRLNLMPIVATLVNAVKELAARVEALEA